MEWNGGGQTGWVNQENVRNSHRAIVNRHADLSWMTKITKCLSSECYSRSPPTVWFIGACVAKTYTDKLRNTWLDHLQEEFAKTSTVCHLMKAHLSLSTWADLTTLILIPLIILPFDRCLANIPRAWMSICQPKNTTNSLFFYSLKSQIPFLLREAILEYSNASWKDITNRISHGGTL